MHTQKDSSCCMLIILVSNISMRARNYWKYFIHACRCATLILAKMLEQVNLFFLYPASSVPLLRGCIGKYFPTLETTNELWASPDLAAIGTSPDLDLRHDVTLCSSRRVTSITSLPGYSDILGWLRGCNSYFCILCYKLWGYSAVYALYFMNIQWNRSPKTQS